MVLINVQSQLVICSFNRKPNFFFNSSKPRRDFGVSMKMTPSSMPCSRANSHVHQKLKNIIKKKIAMICNDNIICYAVDEKYDILNI